VFDSLFLLFCTSINSNIGSNMIRNRAHVRLRVIPVVFHPWAFASMSMTAVELM
jgi:hypothetical protein